MLNFSFHLNRLLSENRTNNNFYSHFLNSNADFKVWLALVAVSFEKISIKSLSISLTANPTALITDSQFSYFHLS